jgi:hypothetical protein
MKALRACALLVVWALAQPAWALDLDGAKRQGVLGEQGDGYVGVVKPSPAAAELARDINEKRRQSYADLAKRNGVSADSVARLAGQKLIDRAGPGEYVRPGGGDWVRK